MPKATLSQISSSLGNVFSKIVHRRSKELNPVLLHLSRAITELDKIIKKQNKGDNHAKERTD